MKSVKINKEMVIKRANRDLIVNINMFLLGQENLKGLFWNVSNIDFSPVTNLLNILISTSADQKLGTTLQKLRKNSKGLSEYLYESGALHCRSRIEFSVYKQEEDQTAKLLRIIESIEIKEGQVV